MGEKIDLIKQSLKERRTLEARKLLDEVDSDLARLEELEEFAQEVNLEPQINVTPNIKVPIDDRDSYENNFDIYLKVDREIFDAYCNNS